MKLGGKEIAGLWLFVAVVSLFVVGSCADFAGAVSTAAKAAGAAGLVDENLANSISASADAIGKAAEEISPEQEYYIGRAVGATILTNYKLDGSKKALTDYLNKICDALVINSPRPEIYNGYHVGILDSDEINAFATPSGLILLTRGLIDCTASEEELAGVIAHEIAHIQLQHSIKSIKTARFTNAILVTGTAVAGEDSLKDLTETFNLSVDDIVNVLNNGYSQDQEFQADTTALSILAGAEYMPSGLIGMLKQLEKIQGSHPGGFNKTHPSPSDRIGNAEKSLGQYKVADTASYRLARFKAVK
jgi:predicted Zn-dependent protease